MTPLRFLPSVLAASAVLFVAPLASALVAPSEPTDSGCATDAECGRGYECTVVGGSGCAPSACADGAKCPPPEPCTTTEIRACTPAHCMVDADCADGMLCHEWSNAGDVASCACAPNVPCDCAPPAPVSVKLCTPRYQLPCETASDCGEGFKCQEAQSCGCSGSAGTPSSGSGAGTPSSNSGATPAPPADSGGSGSSGSMPPDCSCSPTGQFQCVIDTVACQSDTQCPAGWTCSQPVAVSAPSCAPGADCPVPAPEVVSGYCQPPYYGGGVPGDVSLEPSKGGGDTTTGSGDPNSGTPTGGSVPPTTPESADHDDAQAHESSACSFGRAPAGRGVFGLALLLGSIAGLRRRRAQG